MSAEIKAGTEVRLRTGGPVMKVKEINGEMAACEWEVVGRKCQMHFKIKNLLPVAASVIKPG